MRLQDSAANCGPASLLNALRARGVERTQAECEQLCKTSGTDGTSAKNLVRAVKATGGLGAVISEKRNLVAHLYLANWLRMGHPVILCVDDGTHWVAAVGSLAERVLVADPGDNELVLSLSPASMLTRWAEGGRYWGVVV